MNIKESKKTFITIDTSFITLLLVPLDDRLKPLNSALEKYATGNLSPEFYKKPPIINSKNPSQNNQSRILGSQQQPSYLSLVVNYLNLLTKKNENIEVVFPESVFMDATCTILKEGAESFDVVNTYKNSPFLNNVLDSKPSNLPNIDFGNGLNKPNPEIYSSYELFKDVFGGKYPGFKLHMVPDTENMLFEGGKQDIYTDFHKFRNLATNLDNYLEAYQNNNAIYYAIKQLSKAMSRKAIKLQDLSEIQVLDIMVSRQIDFPNTEFFSLTNDLKALNRYYGNLNMFNNNAFKGFSNVSNFLGMMYDSLSIEQRFDIKIDEVISSIQSQTNNVLYPEIRGNLKKSLDEFRRNFQKVSDTFQAQISFLGKAGDQSITSL